MLRPEPCASAPSTDSTIAGRANASTSFDATIPMTPRCQPSAHTTSRFRAPASGSRSMTLRASAAMPDSSSRRRAFSVSSDSARDFASAVSAAPVDSSSRAARSAERMRPAALMRGATWNVTSSLAIRRPVNPLTSSNARRPTVCRPPDSSSRPTLASTRFSPRSGTASARVPIAASLANPRSHAPRPVRWHRACTSLNATPTPARSLSG